MLKKFTNPKNIFIILSLISIIILFLIIRVQPINLRPDAKYDDALMINLASNIIDGKWLGEYNNITLVKGVFTPLFISLLYFIKVPFLFGQMLFYVLSIITFITVMQKIIKKKYILFYIFLYLLFNPVMYSTELCRVYRDGIYTSLIILLVSSEVAIFLNKKESCKRLIKYFMMLGMSFTATYLCREETIWLIPFLIISNLIIVSFIIFDKRCKYKIKRVILYLIPISIFAITNIAICTLNYKNYRVFMLNQYWSKEFKEAYGALTRIKSNTKYDKVPVTKDMLSKAYGVSPTFARLKQYFKQTEFRWSMCGDGDIFEIQGGWFHWALMNGVDSLEYYDNAKHANEFYQKVAEEINEACDSGRVQSYPYKITSNTYKYNLSDIIHIIRKMPNAIKYQYSLSDLKFEIDKAINLEENKVKELSNKFLKITNENICDELTYIRNIDFARLKAMETLYSIYKPMNIIIFYFSILMYIVLGFEFIKNKNKYYIEFIISSGLLTLYLCRIFIVTFTSEFMWTSALNSSYLACIYPIQYMFSLITIYWGLRILDNKLKNKRGKNGTNNTNAMLK